MKRKFVAAAICAALCLMAVACGQQREATVEPGQTTQAAEQTALALPIVAVSSEPEAATHPFTDEEVIILAKTIWAEARGVPSEARQAAGGWCALNRLDDGSFGNTLAEVLTAPHQFAYREDSPETPEMMELAEDVLTRWYAERQGRDSVGRTLPADYLYFEGDGEENHFRKTWEDTGEEWLWAWADPYE